jgi:hypothetical protein
VWVGLAFQAKMLECLARVVARARPDHTSSRVPAGSDAGSGSALVGGGGRGRRLAVVDGGGEPRALPAGRGTYVDGSSGNSLFEQVFGLQRCSVGSVAASPFAGAAGLGLGGW